MLNLFSIYYTEQMSAINKKNLTQEYVQRNCIKKVPSILRGLDLNHKRLEINRLDVFHSVQKCS